MVGPSGSAIRRSPMVTGAMHQAACLQGVKVKQELPAPGRLITASTKEQKTAWLACSALRSSRNSWSWAAALLTMLISRSVTCVRNQQKKLSATTAQHATG